MPEHVTRQGDTLLISGVLSDADGDPVNIQGAALAFAAAPVAGGTALIDFAAASNDQVTDGSDGTTGAWSFTLAAASNTTAGVFDGYVRVTFADASVMTFPNDDFPGEGPILLRVTAKIPVAATVPFASSTDLEERLGLALTAPEHTRAHALLVTATALIRDATGQTLSLVADDALTRAGVWGSRLRLPERPVVSVASVTMDGDAVDTDSWYLDGSELVRSGGWGGPEATLVITYTHGYAVLPEVVKAVAVEMTVRVWVNPGSVAQETSGSQTVRYGRNGGMLLTDIELATVRKLVGAQLGTITLR